MFSQPMGGAKVVKVDEVKESWDRKSTVTPFEYGTTMIPGLAYVCTVDAFGDW